LYRIAARSCHIRLQHAARLDSPSLAAAALFVLFDASTASMTLEMLSLVFQVFVTSFMTKISCAPAVKVETFVLTTRCDVVVAFVRTRPQIAA